MAFKLHTSIFFFCGGDLFLAPKMLSRKVFEKFDLAARLSSCIFGKDASYLVWSSTKSCDSDSEFGLGRKNLLPRKGGNLCLA